LRIDAIVSIHFLAKYIGQIGYPFHVSWKVGGFAFLIQRTSVQIYPRDFSQWLECFRKHDEGGMAFMLL
jgi:hypothetical protein